VLDGVTEQEVRDFRRSMRPAVGDAVRESARIRDPAELAAYGYDLCRPAYRMPLRLAEEFVALVAEDKRGRPLLWAIATSASPPASQLAAVQIALHDESLPTGPAIQVGMLDVERAYAFDGDAESTLVIGGSRPDVDGFQIFGLTIEREGTGGAVVDGVASFTDAAVKLEQLRDLTANDLGIEPVEITPAETLERVVAATRRCGELGLRPSNHGMLAVNLLVRASRIADAEDVLAKLPGGMSPADVAEDEFAEALEAWCESGEVTEELTTLVLFAGCALFEYLAEVDDRPIEEVEGADIKEFLLEHMAGNDDLRDEDAEQVTVALADVLRFLAESGRIERERADELSETVAALTPRFVEADSRARRDEGPAAALVAAMTKDGVDFTDRAAVAAWIAGYNSLTTEERKARVPIPSLGDDVVAAPAAGGMKARTVKARKAQRQARRRNRGR
jgi:hypothetical protein